MLTVLSCSGVVTPATVSLFLLYSNELAGDFFLFFQNIQRFLMIILVFSAPRFVA